MFTQFFFLAGLAAVAFFFLGVVLLGMSLFAETAAGRRRVTGLQSLSLWLLLAFAAGTAWQLQQNLQPWLSAAPPTAASQLLGAERESMTVLMLGLSVVLNSLLAAFAWVRVAQAGKALRCLVWALPGLQLVLGCRDLLGALQSADPASFASTYAGVIRTLQITAGIATGAVLLSWLGGWLRRSSESGTQP